MISYKPFLHYMIDHDIPKSYLNEVLGFSWSTISKLNNGDPVRLDILEKICLHFKIPIEQVMEIRGE